MANLTLKLKDQPDTRIDLSGFAPALAAGASVASLENLTVSTGATAIRLADVFTISGTPGDTVLIKGGADRLDGVGAGMSAGALIVEGDVGNSAGRAMRGGKLEIRGAAGSYLGSGMRAGVIHVTGSAGDFAGAVTTGHRFGMTGGAIIVDGNIGARAGDKMRRGLILVRGRTAELAGSRMVGGTIIAEGGFGATPGQLMRRGTLIGPHVGRLLSTFADCGVHDLVILRVMARAWARELGPLAPKPFPLIVRRFAGDLAAIGKGELLLTRP
jgi:formylmethanofuran dehydrogenase subunit C